MVLLLSNYEKCATNNAALLFARDAFNLDREPIEIIISDYVIFIKYGFVTPKGMIPHDDLEVYYAIDENSDIALINIADPFLLIDYLNQNKLLTNI